MHLIHRMVEGVIGRQELIFSAAYDLRRAADSHPQSDLPVPGSDEKCHAPPVGIFAIGHGPFASASNSLASSPNSPDSRAAHAAAVIEPKMASHLRCALA